MRATSVTLSMACVFLAAWAALAADPVPECPAFGKALPVNNEQVLHWKKNTPNQYRDRGNVMGPVVRVFADRNGHEHFEIQIGPEPTDVVEVVYNVQFGAVPEVKVGMMAQACGDYITSTAPAGPYLASPSGAIVHWVHMNPRGNKHDPGFMMLDGLLYGNRMGAPKPKPQPGRPAWDDYDWLFPAGAVSATN